MIVVEFVKGYLYYAGAAGMAYMMAVTVWGCIPWGKS